MLSAQDLLARARRHDAAAADRAAAVTLAVLAAVLFGASRHAFPAAVIGALGATPVATRRRAPSLSVVATGIASILLSLCDPGTGQVTEGVVAGLCFYTLGCTAGLGRRQLLDSGLFAFAICAIVLSPPHATANDVFSVSVWVLLPYIGGRTVASRRALTRELEANAERARREQDALADGAAAEERTRIARELHDVIAHSLSVMVIQTAAAREVARADPASAREALGAVQLAGREALLEMRRMIGVLRREDAGLGGSATPGVDELDLLAQRARTSGLPVNLEVQGPRRALPEALDLVVFRVVQEALTNSIKHGGLAHTTVTVTFGDDQLELEICDNGSGESSDRREPVAGGHGLLGMRERLALFDGELSTGARPGGGFRVYARVPFEGVH